MSKPKKKEQRAWRLPAVFSVVFLIEFQSGSWNNFMSKTVTSRKVFLVHLYADVLVPGLHRSEAAQKLSLVRLLTENQDWTDCNWREQSVLSVVVQHGEAQERADQLLYYCVDAACHTQKSSKTHQQRALYPEYCFDLTEKSRLFR